MRCAIRNASYLAAHCGVTHLADPVRPRQPSVEFAVVGPGTAALVGGKKFILHVETTQKDWWFQWLASVGKTCLLCRKMCR
jgi:hypothetical protein